MGLLFPLFPHFFELAGKILFFQAS